MHSHVLARLREQEGERGLELVHRLDKETSGLMVLSRNKQSLIKVESMLRQADKGYAVVCQGRFKKKAFSYELELVIEGKKKRAQTKFRVLAQFGEHSLLKCILTTGRNHQIRRHCAALGHPILGDDKYGDFEYNRKYRRKYPGLPLFLHAYDLRPNKSKSRFQSYCLTKPLKAPLGREFAAFVQRYNVPLSQYFTVEKHYYSDV